MKRGVSPVWVGYSDFQNLLMLSFMTLFLVLLANFAELQGDKKDEQKPLAQEIINTIGKENLDKWQAEVLSDGTVRFKNPDYLFAVGSADLRPEFKAILQEFLPKYLSVLEMPQFKSKVYEIHIDGHSSTIWNEQTNPLDAYILNLKLSQLRTSNTLEHILRSSFLRDNHEWFKNRAVSNGYSSSRPIIKSDRDSRNQRVEFKAIIENPLDQNQKAKTSRKSWNVKVTEE